MIVWTSLIGIILGSLSIGYYWGGRVADKRPTYGILSMILLLSAFFITGIALSKALILGYLQQHAASIHLASAVGTFILFAPPSILLSHIWTKHIHCDLPPLTDDFAPVERYISIPPVGSQETY